MASKNNADFQTLYDAKRGGGLKVAIGKGGRLVVQRSEEVPEEPDPLTEAEIEALKVKAFEDGKTSGIAEAVSAHDAALAAACAALANSISQLLDHADAEIALMRREAVELAMITASKLAPALIAREPAAEIEALVEACLESLKTESHIVVRVAESMHDSVETRLNEIAAKRGFAGRVIVAVDDVLTPGDVKVEWQGGGAERSLQAVMRTIDSVIERHVGSGLRHGARTENDNA
jgi:flagellar assembly protein FliH